MNYVSYLSLISNSLFLRVSFLQLAVRTVNSSQSAYACFCFTPLFFQQYVPDPDIQKDCEAVKCKINMKVLSIQNLSVLQDWTMTSLLNVSAGLKKS